MQGERFCFSHRAVPVKVILRKNKIDKIITKYKKIPVI